MNAVEANSSVGLFRGRSEHSLDEKGRLNISARFREVLRACGDERLMITPWDNFIRAYSMPRWEALEMTLLAQDRKRPETSQMIRFVIGGAEECALDKQGRILLPTKMREACKIGRETVVNGVLTHFEIWGREAWEEENRPSAASFRNFEQVLQEVGLF